MLHYDFNFDFQTLIIIKSYELTAIRSDLKYLDDWECLGYKNNTIYTLKYILKNTKNITIIFIYFLLYLFFF